MWSVYYYLLDTCKKNEYKELFEQQKELFEEQLYINTELSIRLGKYIKLCNELKKID